jgi:hypothetical protein
MEGGTRAAQAAAGGRLEHEHRLRAVPARRTRRTWDDQVKRREAFEACRQDAEISVSAPDWHGSLRVGGRRREVDTLDLKALLDRMERLADLDAALCSVAGDFPAWSVWLSDADRWWATRDGSTVDGDDETEIRGLLAAHEEAAAS